MKRICLHPKCSKDIGILPNHLLLCTDHEISFRLFIQDLDHWTDEKLKYEDYFFLFLHQDGCNASELDIWLVKEIGSTSAASSLRRGWLGGTKVGRVWKIPFDEELRAISLARNWISIKQVGLVNKVNPYLFYDFIQEGCNIRVNLSGTRSMLKTEVAVAIEEYKRHNLGARDGARSFRRFAQNRELSPEAFGKIFNVSSTTARNWLSKGYIKSIKRKSCLFIKRREIQKFAQKVIDEDIVTSPEVVKCCQELLTTN